MNGLQSAMPEARLMWHSEGPGRACVVATLCDAEHYVGITLDEEGLTEAALVQSIVACITPSP